MPKGNNRTISFQRDSKAKKHPAIKTVECIPIFPCKGVLT